MKSFFIGTAAASIGAAIARPLLVGTIRAGYEATDAARDAWEKAKAEVDSVKREAVGGREQSHLEAEIRELREELHTLRAQVGKKA